MFIYIFKFIYLLIYLYIYLLTNENVKGYPLIKILKGYTLIKKMNSDHNNFYLIDIDF